MAFMWLMVCMAGSVVQGSNQTASTVLTAAIDDDDTTVSVTSTTGFPGTGVIVIGDEKIAYSSKTATTFTQSIFGGGVTAPIVRGAESTEATAHLAGATVRTVEGGMMNTAATYNVAVMADASGLWAAVTWTLALLRLLGSFMILPISFMGTDLAIIGVLWWCFMAGMLISLGISLAGSRRV